MLSRSLWPNSAIDFFIFTIFNTKVPLMFHANFQPNIPNGSGEEVDFVVFAIFSNGGHLGFLTWPNFTILKPCSLVMLQVKFETHGCSGFREEVVWICCFLTLVFEQNYTRKQKVGHCDKTTHRFFSFLQCSTDVSCKNSDKYTQWFWRRRWFCYFFYF